MIDHVSLHPTALKEELESARAELRRREDEILQLKKKNKELHELAYRDRVTGLATRVCLEEMFEVLEEKTETLCLVMIDLDHFKSVNDTYGHHVGDAILNKFGAILRAASHRENDICARWGGEEFVVVLRDCDRAGAKIYADRLLSRIHEDLVIHLEDERLVRATASIGIVKRMDGEKLPALQIRADRALYDAKTAGRNCIKFVCS